VDRGSQIFPQEVVKSKKQNKKLLHSQNVESPKIYNLMWVSMSEAPGSPARRIKLFVGGFSPKTESFFFSVI